MRFRYLAANVLPLVILTSVLAYMLCLLPAVDRYLVIGCVAFAGVVMLPLLWLSPRPKQVYLPIAFFLLVTEIQALLYFLFGFGFLFLFVLVFQLLSLRLVLGNLRVCPDCGSIIGLHEGVNETHVCRERMPR